MKLTDQPVIKRSMFMSPAHAKAADERAYEMMRQTVIEDGRSAFAWGLPCSPPPYRDPDLQIDWRNGWRWEQEDRSKRERK